MNEKQESKSIANMNWKEIVEKIRGLDEARQQEIVDEVINFMTVEEIIEMGLSKEETTMMIQRKVYLQLKK